MGLSSFKFVQWAPKMHLFCTSAYWPFKVVQGHPRLMFLVPIESACATSCLSPIVTVPITITTTKNTILSYI